MKITEEFCSNGVLIIAILQDINLALEYADHMIFMKHGNVIYELLQPATTISSNMIEQISRAESSLIMLSKNKTLGLFSS